MADTDDYAHAHIRSHYLSPCIKRSGHELKALMAHRLNGGVLSARCSAADLEVVLEGPEKVVGLE